jgi:hypothetical protein
MNDIERNLRQALRRCEPSAGFADRVLAHLAGERPQTVAMRRNVFHLPIYRWAVAAVVLISIGIGLAYRAHQRRVEEATALAARQQVMIALRITGSKLRLARQKVRAVEGGEGKTEKSL